jgi:hypothetical protein
MLFRVSRNEVAEIDYKFRTFRLLKYINCNKLFIYEDDKIIEKFDIETCKNRQFLTIDGIPYIIDRCKIITYSNKWFEFKFEGQLIFLWSHNKKIYFQTNRLYNPDIYSYSHGTLQYEKYFYEDYYIKCNYKSIWGDKEYIILEYQQSKKTITLEGSDIVSFLEGNGNNGNDIIDHIYDNDNDNDHKIADLKRKWGSLIGYKRYGLFNHHNDDNEYISNIDDKLKIANVYIKNKKYNIDLKSILYLNKNFGSNIDYLTPTKVLIIRTPFDSYIYCTPEISNFRYFPNIAKEWIEILLLCLYRHKYHKYLTKYLLDSYLIPMSTTCSLLTSSDVSC